MKTNHFLSPMMLILFFCSGTICPVVNKMQVTGIVISASDQSPISGVVITIKNTSDGVVTNATGYYSIDTQKGDTLIFSFIGFEKQEIPIVGNRIHVQMKESTYILEEAMVATYDNTNIQKTMICGSVSSNSRTRHSVTSTSSEEYGEFTPNRFQQAFNHPLSTFSIDVDAASYANMRRFINGGNLPPENAIRSEELINYFTYDYPQPQGKDPISITTEVSDCPWNLQHRLVHIGLKAKDIEKSKLPVSNLIFLIDVSGSMDEANKLPLLKSSLKLLVTQLRENDRIAIVTYAGNSKEILPSTSGKERIKILQAIEQLEAAGSTAGGAGIELAYQIARQNMVKGGNNRVILATDGDFNVGQSSDPELEKLIEREKESGVFLTVLGYGMGNYKDNKMQVLAQKGNGNHAYIDNLSEAKKVLVNEFGGTLFTVAQDVKLQIEFNPAKVQSYRLIGYESRLLDKEDFNDDKKDAGEIGARHTVTALYEVIPVGVKSNVDELKYQKKDVKQHLTNSPELLTVKLRYKQPDTKNSFKIINTVIDKHLPLSKTSDNFRFSAAVAGFGMLLNHSAYSNNLNFNQVADLARQATGEDREGYRREFIRLVESTDLLAE